MSCAASLAIASFWSTRSTCSAGARGWREVPERLVLAGLVVTGLEMDDVLAFFDLGGLAMSQLPARRCSPRHQELTDS